MFTIVTLLLIKPEYFRSSESQQNIQYVFWYTNNLCKLFRILDIVYKYLNFKIGLLLSAYMETLINRFSCTENYSVNT